MLSIKNLHCSIYETEILKGINLEVNAGEIHVVMGPNGSGKTTLSKILTGAPNYTVTEGSVFFKGKDLFSLKAHERAREGLFLAFQHPVEVPGVTNSNFLKHAVNAIREHRGEDSLDAFDFKIFIKDKMKIVGLDPEFLDRQVNTGFSGGEKKKNEVLQLLALDPSLAILDETDSGLDVDALRTVSEGVNFYRNDSNAIIIVTHYQRLLDYIKPDFIHILIDGKIIKSGTGELALTIEDKGYDWLREDKNGEVTSG